MHANEKQESKAPKNQKSMKMITSTQSTKMTEKVRAPSHEHLSKSIEMEVVEEDWDWIISYYSQKRLLWDLITSLLVLFDCVMTPILVSFGDEGLDQMFNDGTVQVITFI